ncbi:hypothetical protein PUW87_02695 [Metamycoplasma hyosynoviae]|uniref:hypothetical protein n=1 Tax=Metamycoplasma hyosynoviae TaxID=29559 RepID=UPI002366D5C2|nr:hypothetical protein [Metamycoplasma hyosynoviae]MDD7893715.1 hypothetical protein [Metamycoplasma hyosynoviae]MDD7907515.1 hypothetical protein [Metamycoplasma hyosynoviae]
MYINNIFFILYSISIIFTILWTLVFKYFILNKIMLFRIEANEYLRENWLFMPQNFLKKQFYKTAGWYAIWSIPIILFHTALALWGLLGQSSSLLVNILSITNILAMPITVFTNYRFLLIKNHFDFSRKVIPVVHLNTTPFFASANDTNIEEASKFNLMLNDDVVIKFKNNYTEKSYTMQKISKICSKNGKLVANKLNEFLYKVPFQVFVNEKKLDAIQLSLLRNYLFMKLNNSMPYFD